jgi:hypothetical protein
MSTSTQASTALPRAQTDPRGAGSAATVTALVPAAVLAPTA